MALTTLGQILGIEQGVKASAERAFTNAYHQLQRTAQMGGLSRTYEPKDDEGDRLPSEQTLVQIRVHEAIKDVIDNLTAKLDVVATKDDANTIARADVVMEDGTVLLEGVPGVTLLFLEKQLVDLLTFVRKIPTLEPGYMWTWDTATESYVTDPPVQTVRTNKVPKNHVLAGATDKHPAQVQVFMEDIPVGTWTTRKYSGAIPASELHTYIRRVEELQRAVRFARERANATVVVDRKIGKAFLEYVFRS